MTRAGERRGTRFQGIIFSRDRALQLDAVLQSLALHCRDAAAIDIAVLYKATESRYARQYTELIHTYQTADSVRFVAENQFRKDVKELLGLPASRDWIPWNGASADWNVNGNHAFVVFLVDDNIFVRGFEFGSISAALDGNTDALGMSLRLGEHTTYCYAQRVVQTVPSMITVDDSIAKFDWTTAAHDFGYPLELSSSVYRLDDIGPLLGRLKFNSPNSLESAMAGQARQFQRERPFLLCFRKSVVFSNPVNKVQSVFENRAGNAPWNSSSALAELFDQGQRVAVDRYAGIEAPGCHHEIDLILKRRESR